MATWLKDAIFYEIYPQSFYDTNGDGIGDFNGITAKLDYIKSLGCNAIWMNPCFDSPFSDAGYDVRDYKKVAERYGTMEDIENLFAEAHKRDMHILLDLVPQHLRSIHGLPRAKKLSKMNTQIDICGLTDGSVAVQVSTTSQENHQETVPTSSTSSSASRLSTMECLIQQKSGTRACTILHVSQPERL